MAGWPAASSQFLDYGERHDGGYQNEGDQLPGGKLHNLHVAPEVNLVHLHLEPSTLCVNILQLVMRLRRELADSEQARQKAEQGWELAQAQLDEANAEVRQLWEELAAAKMAGYADRIALREAQATPPPSQRPGDVILTTPDESRAGCSRCPGPWSDLDTRQQCFMADLMTLLSSGKESHHGVVYDAVTLFTAAANRVRHEVAQEEVAREEGLKGRGSVDTRSEDVLSPAQGKTDTRIDGPEKPMHGLPHSPPAGPAAVPGAWWTKERKARMLRGRSPTTNSPDVDTRGKGVS